jgi:DNA-binding MarR family transcriptional regulator
VEDQIGFLLRVVNQRYGSLFSHNMIEGLTVPQFATLAKLREVGPCSQSKLASLIHLDAATMKGVVDRLIGRGYLISADTPANRRRGVVGLTDKGLTVTDEAIVAAQRIGATAVSPLDAEERVQILALLRKLKDAPEQT